MIEREPLERVVEALSRVGSHPLGFRVAGTPEDRATAELIAAEMRSIGLTDVALEQVPVDGWHYRGGSVTLSDGTQWEAASLGSFPPTPADGVTGVVVAVGDGRRTVLDRLDLNGRIALLDWRRIPVDIADIVLELGLRGAVAVVLTSLDGGARFQGEGGPLGACVSAWHEGSPPLVTLRKRDAYELLDRGRVAEQTVTVRLDVTIERGAAGWNAVGVLRGARNDRAPIVVGAHHDAWFRGAWDNATGVAAMLAIARDLVASGWVPPRPVLFTSHTGEEYGVLGDPWPWCHGAWQQLAVSHPRWGATVPFYLNVEASGHPKLPVLVEGPPELRRFATPFFRRATRERKLPHGWRFSSDPVTGTEAWPFQLAGIPSLSVYNWHTEMLRTDYHSTNDVPALVDFGYLEDLTNIYRDILVAAAEGLDGLLDYDARRDELQDGDEALAAAARGYAERGSRDGFRRLVRGGIAVDADGNTGYLHTQAATDVRHLGEALEALGRDDRRAAARAAANVGMNAAYPYLSHEAFTASRARVLQAKGTWLERSHPTATPDLWQEIASLRGARGARPYGPWVARSLERHRVRMVRERDRRVARLTALLGG